MNTCERIKKQIEDTRERMDRMLGENKDISACYEISTELDRLIAEYILLQKKEAVQ
ncbi:MAG: Spo0E family sporulation regulatory protein-aspartic acid phosphatase [Lachnospiraceae bacterium]|nr:Spo0E family sporulation regulatory protein-aspartic acid phosphatase [Lachnospiraceae bacterium]